MWDTYVRWLMIKLKKQFYYTGIIIASLNSFKAAFNICNVFITWLWLICTSSYWCCCASTCSNSSSDTASTSCPSTTVNTHIQSRNSPLMSILPYQLLFLHLLVIFLNQKWKLFLHWILKLSICFFCQFFYQLIILQSNKLLHLSKSSIVKQIN